MFWQLEICASKKREEHEKSIAYRNCSESYFLNCSKADINNLLRGRPLTAQVNLVKKRRQGLERVVISHKSFREEGPKLQTGGKWGSIYPEWRQHRPWNCFGEHLSAVILKSKKLHGSTGSRGRGSHITLLCKTTCCGNKPLTISLLSSCDG